MNPLVRLAVALAVAVGLVLVDPSSPVAWVFGAAFFVVIMGVRPSRRRR